MAKFDAKLDWAGFLSGAAVVLVGCIAYAHSFSGPLVFDDQLIVSGNPTIRHLWPLGPVLHPPSDGSPVTGRPAVNLSLAVNYALGGLDVRGYHAFNLGIHLLAGLALFGIVRRTLAGVSKMRPPWTAGLQGLPATPIALAVAAIWTVHPLQTESVTYISGRTESLMGLLYLVTLYSFIRATLPLVVVAGAEPGASLSTASVRVWSSLAVATCLAGMAAKEVMVSAPLMILLYDRTFVSGSFSDAWRKRPKLYLLLGGTWLLLVWLMAHTGDRGGTVGFNTHVPWWRYAAIQGRVIAHYLHLAFWPHPLVIDYGRQFGGSASVLVLDGLLVGALLGATVVALWRKPLLGFLGAWFFAILAPSSSLVPVATELIAERRMYLPLAAVCALVVIGLYRSLGSGSLFVWIGLAAGLCLLTMRRNEDYRSAQSLWSVTVQVVPGNAGAHNNLGGALLAAGDRQAAIEEFREALNLDPLLAGAHNNLGLAFGQEKRWEEARNQFEEAMRLAPAYEDARSNLATAFFRLGRLPEAIAGYREVSRLRPGDAAAHHHLALALDKAGQLSDAIAEYEQASHIDPGAAEIHYDLGNILVRNRRLPEAINQFEEAVRLRPAYAEARANLGGALLETGSLPEAISQYKEALRLKPELVEAQVNLGSALLEMGRPEEAIAFYRAALLLRPDYATAHHDLGVALRSVGRLEEAAAQFEMASRLGEGR